MVVELREVKKLIPLLKQIGVPFWAEGVVYGLALVGCVAPSRHLTRRREEQARRPHRTG